MCSLSFRVLGLGRREVAEPWARVRVSTHEFRSYSYATPTSPNFICSCAVLSLVRVRGFLSKFDFYNCPIPGHSTSPRNQLARPGISLPRPCLALSLCQHLHLAVRTTDVSTFKFAHQIQFSTIPAHERERLSHGAVRNLPIVDLLQ